MKSFTVTMPEPPSANRWWRTAIIPAKGKTPARVNTYLSKEAREYKERIARASSLVVDGPVALHIRWFRGREAGDLDKRLGVAIDAMQGVFYRNDKQIVDIHAQRFSDPANPRLVVTVREVEPALILFDNPDTVASVLEVLVEAARSALERDANLMGDPLQVEKAIAAGKRILSAL